MDSVLDIFNSVAAAHGIMAVEGSSYTAIGCANCMFDANFVCPSILCNTIENLINGSMIIVFKPCKDGTVIKYEDVKEFVAEAAMNMQLLLGAHK